MVDGLTGLFIQEFYDCTNMHLLFRDLSKHRDNRYLLTAEPDKERR